MAVTVIVSLFTAGNYYIFSRVNLWLSLGWGFAFPVAGATLGLFSFLLILFHVHPFRPLFWAAASWFGLVCMMFPVFVVADGVTRILPLTGFETAYGALAASILLAIYAAVNNLSARSVLRVSVTSPKVADSMRIVLIADTHITRYHGVGYVRRLVGEINCQGPDIVAIAGDFADGKTDFSLIEPVNNIKVPIYMVMGNHEVWHNQNGEMERLLRGTKITVLDGGTHTNDGLCITGIHYGDGRDILKKAFRNIECDREYYNILLYHEPKDAHIARDAGIDLMLCGHAHGGQIFPWNYVTRLAYPYFKGLYDYKGMKIYVSQGTGTWGPPMRLGSRNEITVIDVNPVNAHETV